MKVAFMKNEIEARFVIDEGDRVSLINKIESEGFTLVQPECLMKRYVYSIPNKDKSYYARVRDEGHRITATVKCVSSNTIEGVQEAEIQVNSFDDAHALFSMMGLGVKGYQETKREHWKKGSTELMIDTWPGLPTFIEIEGESEAEVKNTSQALGFDWSDAGFGAIDTLYTKYLGWSADEINTHPEIKFDNPPQARK